MRKKLKLIKVVDEANSVLCRSGVRSERREEVWLDKTGRVMRYNLAFVLPVPGDNGRVLGYDNAHGVHERHANGKVAEVEYESYATTLARFTSELNEIRSQA